MSTEKRKVNIGTIGHVDHGKTTLSAAIAHTQGLDIAVDKIDKAPEEKARGITISTTTINYPGEKYDYAHTDCPGHADYVKNMITGSRNNDISILVLAATDGVLPQTKEHLGLIRPDLTSDIPDAERTDNQLVVFLNKCDIADPEFIPLCKMELEELLEQYGFKDYKFFEGSALKALEGSEKDKQVIRDMFEYIETNVRLPARDINKPFEMNIEGTFQIPGRGTVASGKVLRGSAKKDDVLRIVGYSKNDEVRVLGTQAFLKDIPAAEAGMNVGLLIKGLEHKEIKRGMVLCAKDSDIKSYNYAKINFLLLDADNNGRKAPIKTGYKPQFFIGTGDCTGTIHILPKADAAGNYDLSTPLADIQLAPGEYSEVIVKFLADVPLRVGSVVFARESNKTIGTGKVIEVMTEEDVKAATDKKIIALGQ